MNPHYQYTTKLKKTAWQAFQDWIRTNPSMIGGATIKAVWLGLRYIDTPPKNKDFKSQSSRFIIHGLFDDDDDENGLSSRIELNVTLEFPPQVWGIDLFGDLYDVFLPWRYITMSITDLDSKSISEGIVVSDKMAPHRIDDIDGLVFYPLLPNVENGYACAGYGDEKPSRTWNVFMLSMIQSYLMSEFNDELTECVSRMSRDRIRSLVNQFNVTVFAGPDKSKRVDQYPGGHDTYDLVTNLIHVYQSLPYDMSVWGHPWTVDMFAHPGTILPGMDNHESWVVSRKNVSPLWTPERKELFLELKTAADAFVFLNDEKKIEMALDKMDLPVDYPVTILDDHSPAAYVAKVPGTMW